MKSHHLPRNTISHVTVRLAFAVTGNHYTAEEFAQDAFVTAHRDWARLSGYDDLGAWVRRVATNRCAGRVVYSMNMNALAVDR